MRVEGDTLYVGRDRRSPRDSLPGSRSYTKVSLVESSWRSVEVLDPGSVYKNYVQYASVTGQRRTRTRGPTSVRLPHPSRPESHGHPDRSWVIEITLRTIVRTKGVDDRQ